MALIVFFARTVFVSVVWLSLLALLPSFGQNTATTDLQNARGTIAKLEIRGLENVDISYVRSLLVSQEQGLLSPFLVSTDVRSIFQLGFADDVKVEVTPAGANLWNLIFTIKEKPRINEVILMGNKVLSDESIREKIRLRRFSILNTETMAQDVQAILNLYKEKKIFTAKVYYSLESVGPQKVNLVYHVIENPAVYITEIRITGTKYFSALELERVMVSSRIDCFSWMTSSGVLDENRINQDMQVIYQTYANVGFIKLKIHKPRIRIIESPTESRAIIDFYLEEGDQYSVGKVDVEGTVGESLLVKKEELLEKLQLKSGDIFSLAKFNQDRFFLDDFYQDRGYAFNRVSANTPINESNKTVDLLYSINHFDKVYINRVNILGNESTYDYVVRRELDVLDQEMYRSSKVQNSQRKLNQLGFFEANGGVNFERSLNDDKTLDYNILLKEAQTGSLNLSLTYSEVNGLGAAVQIAKRNLFGKGNSVSFRLSAANRQTYSADVAYSHYYFLDSRWTSISGASVSSAPQYDSTGDKAYDQLDYRLSQSFGLPFWPDWSIYYSLFLQSSTYRNVSSIGRDMLDNKTLMEQRGLGLTLEYNSVDNPLFSSNGQLFSIGYDYIGAIPGGTETFGRANFRYQYFKSLSDDRLVVFMSQLRFTQLYELDKKRPIPQGDRLSAGGITTIRGFDYQDIEGASSYADRARNFSPTTLKATNPELYRYYVQRIGGTSMGILNVETLFPISRDQSYLRGVVFFDMGNVWSEPKTYQITGAKLSYMEFKKSYGAGIRLITPAGVIRFEYANVINPKPNENTGKAELYVGALF